MTPSNAAKVYANPARLLLAVFAVAYAAFLLLFLHHREIVLAHDDAFITYTYSRNLGLGEGLVFQSGERVWGFTSPAHTLSLAALATAGIPPTRAAPALGIALAMLSGLLVFELLRQLLRQDLLPALAALVLMTATPLFFAFPTLEGNLLVFCQLLALLFLVRGTRFAGALVAGLACLVRPNAIVLFAPMAFLERKRLLRPRYVLAFLTPGIAWLTFAALYYGTVLPQPLFGKRGKTALLEYLPSAAYFGFGTGFPLEPQDKVTHWSGWLILGIEIAVVLGGWVLARNRFRVAGSLQYAMFVYPWVLITCYGVIGAPEHFWEIQSGSFFFHLGLAFSVCALVIALAGKQWPARGRFELSGFMKQVVAPATALVIVALNVSTTLEFFVRQQESFWRGSKYRTYRAAAAWMNENLPQGSRVAVSEIGVLGYYAERYRIVDLAGLVTPTFGPRGFRGNRFILEHFRPDFALVPPELAGPEYRGWAVRPVHRFPEVAGVGPFDLVEIVQPSEAEVERAPPEGTS